MTDLVLNGLSTQRLRAADWIVRSTAHAEASAFIRRYHYARSCPKVRVYSFGLFKEVLFTPIMGASVWLPPLPPVGAAVYPEGDHKKVLALSRLAIHPDVPSNAASFMIGRCIREIKRDGKWECLVTFADTRMGHEGAIYKATNWEYMGETEPKDCWVDPATGKQVSIKATFSRTNEKMLSLGYERIGAFPKHRFRMVLR
jgi:hypothetical protein